MVLNIFTIHKILSVTDPLISCYLFNEKCSTDVRNMLHQTWVTFDIASMNFTPLYETDRIMLGILEIFRDDFCQLQHDNRLWKNQYLVTDSNLCDGGKVQTTLHIDDSCGLTRQEGDLWCHSAVDWLTSYDM